MNPFRRLRWQMVFSHMLVVIAGVATIMLASRLIFISRADALIAPQLELLVAAGEDVDIAAATATLNQTFRGIIILSVILAAAGALLAGAVTSVLLTQRILNPLDRIVEASRRIANGRYEERIDVPSAALELTTVAEQFNLMAESLAQVEARRLALIGNVSHELRTPLTALQGYIEGLLDGLFPSSPETFAAMGQDISRLRRLIDDLQELSRVEAGQLKLTMTDFDLSRIVRRVTLQLEPQAQAKRLSLAFTPPADAAPVHADADRAAQILINLVGNAIRYTEEGGAITVTILPGPRTTVVQIADTGIGVPAAALPYLFERFYRVDSSRSRTSGGSGIGLTIARRLAWAMGGELTAASPGPGAGSTFTLTLPHARGATPKE